MQVYNRSYKTVNNLSCFTLNKHGCNVQSMKFSERLKAARKYAELTQQQLVDKLPLRADGKAMMSQANLAKMEKNEKTEGSNFSYYIAIACGINPEWLINEAGSMTSQPYTTQDSIEQKVLAVMAPMSEYEKVQFLRIGHTLAKPEESNGKHNTQ